MAEETRSGAEDSQCVNLLYLASTQRDKGDQIGQVFNQDDIAVQGVDDGNTSAENAANIQQEAAPVINRLTKPSSTSFDQREARQICPRVNCPEKIIICLDVSDEMEKVSFRSRSGDKFSPLKLVKRALGIFMHSKHRLNPRHEYALVLLQEQAMWMSPLTNSPDKILAILEDFENTFPTEMFDLASIFDVIHRNIELPKVSDPALLPPPYTVRALLLYGRSHCVPTFTNKQSFKLLLSSPHFFCDALYIHEIPSEDNLCESVFEKLCDLDEKGLFYVFEVSKNPTRLYDCVAQLLPHPLQRPLQCDAEYKLEPKPEQ